MDDSESVVGMLVTFILIFGLVVSVLLISGKRVLKNSKNDKRKIILGFVLIGWALYIVYRVSLA